MKTAGRHDSSRPTTEMPFSLEWMISAVPMHAVAVASGSGVSRENPNTANSTSAKPAPPVMLLKSDVDGDGKKRSPMSAPSNSSEARNGVRKNANVGFRPYASTAAANDNSAPIAIRAFRRRGQNR